MAFYCNGKQGICDCDILCADCKFYDDKGGKDVQTNADRIRAMSDEDLKDSILAVHHGYAPWCDYHCENKGDDGCDRCIEKWLQQPAEDFEDG